MHEAWHAAPMNITGVPIVGLDIREGNRERYSRTAKCYEYLALNHETLSFFFYEAQNWNVDMMAPPNMNSEHYRPHSRRNFCLFYTLIGADARDSGADGAPRISNVNRCCDDWFDMYIYSFVFLCIHSVCVHQLSHGDCPSSLHRPIEQVTPVSFLSTQTRIAPPRVVVQRHKS